MSLLFKHLRVHQVFGANTDVGKTVLTSGLVRASATKNNRVFYLKPVSTGPIQDADDEHVKRYAGPHTALINAHCLYRFDEPVSPHLAAGMAVEKEGTQNVVVPTDDAFVTSVANYIRKCASGITGRSHMYIETAGGETGGPLRPQPDIIRHNAAGQLQAPLPPHHPRRRLEARRHLIYYFCIRISDAPRLHRRHCFALQRSILP